MWMLSERWFAGPRLLIKQRGRGIVSLVSLAVAAPLFITTSSAVAQSPTKDDLIFARSAPDFWPAAQKILESQATWFNRAEIALSTPDPLVNQILSTKLLVQLRSMDLFVQRYYRNPPALCQSKRSSALLGASAGLELKQIATYCAIYKMSRDLTPLRNRLTQRSSLFNAARNAIDSNRFVARSKSQILSPTSIEQVNLASRALQLPPQSAFIYPQMVGVQRMKQLQANYRPPVAPAIVPPTELIRQINQGRSQLLTIQASLPTGSQTLAARAVQVFKPQEAVVSKYAVRPSEVNIYADFLTQPNTGISRVYPAAQFVTQQNRLNPQMVPMPFGLRIEDGQFILGGKALNYGFVTSIGKVDIAKVNTGQALPEIFSTYEPPNTLAKIQNHQRRFLIGKDTPLSSAIPVELQQTYVMRLVQYQLPELVQTGRPLQSGERGNLKALLEHQGSDRLIAFRPMSRRIDGSYTILWKILETKAAPQIADLDRYISTHLKTRSRP